MAAYAVAVGTLLAACSVGSSEAPEATTTTTPEASSQGDAGDGAGSEYDDHASFEHDGITRHYRFHAPDDLAEGAPLVVVLHGYGGRADALQRWIGFDRVADDNGFAVAYPQGTGDGYGATHWDARLDLSETDDTGFLTALARQLQAEQGLDPRRTFVAGISNGGFMGYVLAMEAPETFHAVASVTGTMSGDAWEVRDSGAVFPLLQVSGVDDPLVPIDGSMSPEGGWGGAPGMDAIIDYWSDRNGCLEREVDRVNPLTTLTRHVDCESGNPIWFYAVDDFGHSWPDVGNSAGFDGATRIWEFFSRLGP